MSDERKKKDSIAESVVKDGVVTFTFKGTNKAVSLDVNKLSPAMLLMHACDGVRTGGRLSFQKLEDPVKAAEALENRFSMFAAGTFKPHARTAGEKRKEPDDLTVALSRVLNKPTSFIEETFYPRYFASPDSGCTTRTTSDKKTRVYGKEEALEKLRNQPQLKPHLAAIAAERAKGKAGTIDKLDLSALAA